VIAAATATRRQDRLLEAERERQRMQHDADRRARLDQFKHEHHLLDL
jgi:hypothetical protein